MGANSTLGVNISAGTLANPVNGPSSAIVNIIETAAQNTTINSDMNGFTGTINCPTTAGTSAKAQMTSTAFSINPGATINVSNGGTLYVVNPGVTIPCALNLYGFGNTEAYGALRIEKGALISGHVTLYGNTSMGNSSSGAAAANVATISGAISGAYGITFTLEPGTIVLSGANTYTGINTFTGSVVQVASPEIPGTSRPLGKSAASNPGNIVWDGGQLQYSSVNQNDYSGRFSTAANQRYTVDLNAQTVTFATPLTSSGGSLGVQSSVAGGKLILSAANTYTGPTTNQSGTVQLASPEISGTSGPLGKSAAVNPGSIYMSGGTLQYTAANGAGDYSGRFTTTNASQSYNIDVNGQNVAYASGLISTGGTLTVSSTLAGGTLTLLGTNFYTGGTTVNQGSTLFIAGAGYLGTTNGVTNYAGGITDNGTLNYASSTNQVFLGAITGVGSLIQSGTGTLSLSNAANAYYGGTTVSNGTLNVNATGSIQGNVRVAAGVLQLDNAAALNPGAILTLASSPSAGAVNLNFSGVQTISALNFGTTSMPSGTYGALGNGSVTYQNAAFTGSGILNVVDQMAYWDPSPSLDGSPGNGGTGSWDTSTFDWWVSGGSDSQWTATNVANFAGSAGTVTLNAGVTASGLTFTTSGYTVTGGSTLTLQAGSATNGTPVISIPAGNTTISCPIASSTTSNSVVVSGPGTLTLSGDNAAMTNSIFVTGGATLSVNTISDSSPTALGTGTNVSFYNGNLTFTGSSGQTARTITFPTSPTTTTITVSSGNTLELDGQVHTTGAVFDPALTFNGGGTLILGNSVDDSGLNMAINAGTVVLNTTSINTVHSIGGGTSYVANGATLKLAGTGGCDIYASAILMVASGGIFDLNGQTVNMSVLNIAGNGAGSGALVDSSGGYSIMTNAVALTGNTTVGGSGSISMRGVISGGFSLTQSGSGMLTLGAANTFSGGLNLNDSTSVTLTNLAGAGAGTIAIGHNSTLVMPWNLSYASTYYNTVTGDSTAMINFGMPAGNTFEYFGLSGFNGTINVGVGSGSGQMVLNGVPNEAYPPSTNATWNIQNGVTLDLQTPFVVDPAMVVVNGSGNAYGCLRLDACNQQGNVLLNAGNCTIGDGNTSGSSMISGVISDGGNGYGFIKVGVAYTTITLTASNTYTGPTIVSNGTLGIALSGSIATSCGLTLDAGTALDVSGVTNGSGSYSLLGTQGLTNYGSATIIGSLNLSAGASLTLQCTNFGSAMVVSNGTLTLNNNPITVTVYGNGPVPGNYPLITNIASITGTGQGIIAGSVSSSTLTINNQNANTAGTLAISNNTLYMIITASAPTILGQSPPGAGGSPTTLYVGAHPNFSVSAIGQAPLQYLWFTNGVLMGGATTNTAITLTNVQLGTLTTYCLVSNNVSYPIAASATWTANVVADPTAPYPVTVLADNPMGYWRLNEADQGYPNDGVIADDYWGGNEGIYTNVSLGSTGYNNETTDPGETSMVVGYASFADSDTYGIPGVNFGTPASTTTNFSVEAWVLSYPQTADAGIVSLGSGGGEQFNLDTGSDSLATHGFRFFVRDASGATHGASSAIVPNSSTWFHLVGVCDETHGIVTLYINGVASATGAITPGSGLLASTRNMLIGARPSSATSDNNDQFVGNIGDVAVYNYALSASQVAAHYASAGVAPALTQAPPATVNIDAGATMALPVTAIGTQPLGYYWADLGGGTNLVAGLTNANMLNASLTVSNVPASWNGDTLQLTVSNAYGSINFQVALNVTSGLVASLTPTNLALSVGQSFTYTAQAAGTVPIAYQWYAGNLGAPISNATNASYTPTAMLGDSTYICQVSNGSGSTNLSLTLTGLPYLTFDWVGVGWSGGESGTYASNPVAYNNGVLTLTDGSGSITRSVFFGVPQYIGAFSASFTYQAGGNKAADGIAFVQQNDPRGATALGGGGGSLAVSGITPSFELEMDLYNAPKGGYAVTTNGNTGVYTLPGTVNITVGDPITVTEFYAQGQLSLTFTDAVASTSFSTNLNVGSLPSRLGTNTAYVGFTGASGGSTAIQTISNFAFISLMSLTAQVSGTNMVVSWPADVSLYQLQSTASLAAPNWVNVNNPVTVANGMNQVTVPLSGGAAFYRLQLQ